jgi:hypothetical protein
MRIRSWVLVPHGDGKNKKHGKRKEAKERKIKNKKKDGINLIVTFLSENRPKKAKKVRNLYRRCEKRVPSDSGFDYSVSRD